MPELDPTIRTLPVDTAINGDAYMPGLSNPVTSAEIQDIALNPQNPVQERLDALGELRREMVARDSADTLPDTKSLIAEIDSHIAMLNEPGEGTADPDVLRQADTAVDPDNLSGELSI